MKKLIALTVAAATVPSLATAAERLELHPFKNAELSLSQMDWESGNIDMSGESIEGRLSHTLFRYMDFEWSLKTIGSVSKVDSGANEGEFTRMGIDLVTSYYSEHIPNIPAYIYAGPSAQRDDQDYSGPSLGNEKISKTGYGFNAGVLLRPKQWLDIGLDYRKVNGQDRANIFADFNITPKTTAGIGVAVEKLREYTYTTPLTSTRIKPEVVKPTVRLIYRF